jgi:hypothetical protein
MTTYAEANEEKTRLVLLQSAIGEATWKGHEIGEDLAILWIYKKRQIKTGWTLYKVVKEYSAAVKVFKAKPNKWINFIPITCEKPTKHWKKKWKWENYKADCLSTRSTVDAFLAGETVDPLPDADFYGSRTDVPKSTRMKLIKTKYRNLFYNLI